MPLVAVFKTNVCNTEQSQPLLGRLLAMHPHCRINFDIEDCDRVLRVEGENVDALSVVMLMQEHGFVCEELV